MLGFPTHSRDASNSHFLTATDPDACCQNGLDVIIDECDNFPSKMSLSTVVVRAAVRESTMAANKILPDAPTSTLPARKSIPPFEALRAFDAVARLGGMRKLVSLSHGRKKSWSN